jgi:hypothetical protein
MTNEEKLNDLRRRLWSNLRSGFSSNDIKFLLEEVDRLTECVAESTVVTTHIVSAEKIRNLREELLIEKSINTELEKVLKQLATANFYDNNTNFDERISVDEYMKYAQRALYSINHLRTK